VDAQARPTGEYMANHPRGPVLAGVTDTAGAGNVHFGINTPTPSPNLHPVLRRRLAALSESRSPTLGGVAPQASAGTHAEVHALNAAMNASGHAAHDEDLSRYMLHNVAIGASRTLQGVPPRCTWCHALTAGVRVVEGDHEDEARPPAAPAKPKPKPKPDDGESKEGQ
jgi:hypothetical protein